MVNNTILFEFENNKIRLTKINEEDFQLQLEYDDFLYEGVYDFEYLMYKNISKIKEFINFCIDNKLISFEYLIEKIIITFYETFFTPKFNITLIREKIDEVILLKKEINILKKDIIKKDKRINEICESFIQYVDEYDNVNEISYNMGKGNFTDFYNFTYCDMDNIIFSRFKYDLLNEKFPELNDKLSNESLHSISKINNIDELTEYILNKYSLVMSLKYIATIILENGYTFVSINIRCNRNGGSGNYATDQSNLYLIKNTPNIIEFKYKKVKLFLLDKLREKISNNIEKTDLEMKDEIEKKVKVEVVTSTDKCYHNHYMPSSGYDKYFIINIFYRSPHGNSFSNGNSLSYGSIINYSYLYVNYL